MGNSVRQMLRTPVRTAFFLVLLSFASFLMCIGLSLWIKNEKRAEEYENKFITIGTVRQKPDSFEQKLIWDAEKKDYQIWRGAQYASYLTEDALDILGVDYLAGPEQRAYYASWAEDYVTVPELNSISYIDSFIAVEFSPLEDARPEETIQIKITKVFGRDTTMENSVVFFCDHENPEPDMLYHDKTYAALLGFGYKFAHGEHYERIKAESPVLDRSLEYVPVSVASSLYGPDGSRVEDAFQDGQAIFEVSEGFYETEGGKRLLDLAEIQGYYLHTQPVTGTDRTCLLMPFYNGDSYICEGRDIREEEYETGSKVCLAPRAFMENNGLSIGDTVKTQLFYTNTRRNAGSDFWLDGNTTGYKIIDERGNRLEPFETSEYTVVGIYDTRKNGGDYAFRSGSDELIVPLKSIASGKAENLISCGPMTDSTTSFQIPNGTVEEFQKQWTRYGTPELEISFYDMGYSKCWAGIENMRNLSLLFLIVGILLTVLLLFFFCHLFITKQAGRTAIERALGMSRLQCAWSVLSGLMLVVLLGSIAGSAAGAVVSKNITADGAEKTYYDDTFSVGRVADEGTEITAETATEEYDGRTAGICSLLVIAAGGGISVTYMKRSLKREPMSLLREMQRE